MASDNLLICRGGDRVSPRRRAEIGFSPAYRKRGAAAALYVCDNVCTLEYNVLVMCLLYAHSNPNRVLYVVCVIKYVWGGGGFVN